MKPVTIFLAGDVMTGRGLDQAMPHPGDPTLHEPGIRDARRYVELAEAAHGPITRPIAPGHPWGDALGVLDAFEPVARIVNLETSITTSDDWCRAKDIHYRMHPENIGCLSAAGIQVASLANNHTLDWGRAGLAETLDSLRRAGILAAGAGSTLEEARRPAIVPRRGGGRVLVFAAGSCTSGIPPDWIATDTAVGIDLLPSLDEAVAAALCARVAAWKQPGDIAVLSIHWGSNWGFDVPEEFTAFARRLVDGGIDLVHGHSSHHVRPIEVYRERLILYGCGDLLDDYEGIAGHTRYRGDLGLLYFPSCDAATGRLVGLSMVPMQARRFRLLHPGNEAACWLRDTLSRISRPFGCAVEIESSGILSLRHEAIGAARQACGRHGDAVPGEPVSSFTIHQPAEHPAMPTSLRLFLAVDPPATASAQARRIIDRLTRAGIGATWVDPTALHLTLHFLGNDVEPSRLPAIRTAIDRACSRTAPFAIEFGGLGAFPDMRQPRIIWLGVRRGADSLAEFHDTLRTALEPLGFAAEARGYHPHLTLGRLRPDRRAAGPAAGRVLAAEAGRLADDAAGEFFVHEVCLYSSRLEPTGPIHTRLHAAKLAPGNHGQP